MLTRELSFFSDGIRLDGLLQMPDGLRVGERRQSVVLCSGFQGLKELIPAKLWGPLTWAGFICFAFDYRGLGTSAGERGRIIPAEQVADVRAAITLVQQQPEVEPTRIGLVGWGFGGGIVVQAAAEDERVAAVACLNGIGDGGRAVRRTRLAEDWLAIQQAIVADRVERTLTGRSRLVSPWVVVPLDPRTRQNVDEDMYGNHPRFAQADVSLQSAEAYYAFRPELAAERISPRPLLIVHGQQNALHSIEEARCLFAHAREPKELIEIPGAHHLDWIQPSDPHYQEYIPRIIAWLLNKLA
jgi:alpha-beta hydrolase superfamily lysophospholipase